MNLQLHLLYRIAMVALLCLLVIASYSLYQSHRQAEQATKQMAEGLGRQLESQLMLIEAGIGRTNPFPDFELWKQNGSQPGICVAYAAAVSAASHSVCNGAKTVDADWPAGFETIYRRIFNPGRPALRSIMLRGRVYGSLTVTPSAELEIAEAWNKTRNLMTLSTVTVSAVCLLVYLSISRALKPAQTIVAGLEDMETGRLAYRLPPFELNEWQRIGSAINQLAASQQQLLEERQKLVVKSINVQEEERRYLARELHDEFGQCLAAINAVAASIKQTAAQQCPDLVDEADHISRITAHMLGSVRDLLGRLRPAEFDELGLAASLNSLVAGWNGRGGGKTRYRLSIDGNCAALPEAQAVTLFRITQECLTNISKHAAASGVGIGVTISPEAAVLTVKDDGIATELPFTDTGGIGLLGIRERAAALHGRLNLAIAEPHGLIVEVRLPMTEASI
ncbi:MAG: histidine kinase [Methylobacter tundripaludum]|uniref:Histidine kinase n=1 Tax=Methylobacter tundripaludum TaxID=173365 RepID=A0A2S6H797_9GAMM|nr:histidine kinase [Methylobacter tundripaludum]MCK9636565.1 histidine kinase [Methylobacter tundripaludum]PPK73266.1 histidine kinase [Methylobacter tundripaludum]